jgi:hypothetical protein
MWAYRLLAISNKDRTSLVKDTLAIEVDKYMNTLDFIFNDVIMLRVAAADAEMCSREFDNSKLKMSQYVKQPARKNRMKRRKRSSNQNMERRANSPREQTL